MKIPQKAWNQMTFLCSKINKLEWSGVLFYNIEGDVNNLDTFKVVVEEVFLMDKGTSAATDFEMGGAEIDHMMQNQHLFTALRGVMHSHAGMNVFFSGTDNEDLWRNSLTNNFFLSLIINNNGDAISKIGWRGKTTTKTNSKITLLDSNGKPFEMLQEQEVEEEVLILAEAEIEIENTIDSWFIKRFHEINNYVKPVMQTTTNIISNFGQRQPIPAPILPTDKAFLVDWLSMGKDTNLDTFINRTSKFAVKSMQDWEVNMWNDNYFDTTFEKHYKGSVRPKQVEENLLKALTGYKLSNQKLYNIITDIIQYQCSEALEDIDNGIDMSKDDFVSLYDKEDITWQSR